MDASGINYFVAAIILIPLAVAATIGVLFLITLRWRAQVESELKEINQALRQFQNDYRQVMQALNQASPADPEPYASASVELQKRVQGVHEQVTAMLDRRNAAQKEYNRLHRQRWETLPGAPYLWYSLRDEVRSLWVELENTRRSLEAADRAGQALNRIAWDVARQARKVDQLFLQAHQEMDALRSLHLQGNAFDIASRMEQQAQAALDEIPPYFLSSSERSISEQADKESVAMVYQIVVQQRPTLEKLNAQALTWKKGYNTAAEKVSALRSLLSEFETLLSGIPPNLDVTAYRENEQRLQEISKTLQATLARLEVESIDQVVSEAERQTQAVQQMQGELVRARQQLGQLENILDELSSGLGQLSAEFALLGSKSKFPIAWEESKTELTRLSRQRKQIGTVTQARSPEQVSRDYQLVSTLLKEQQALARRVQQVEQQHDELAKLLALPELSQLDKWLDANQATIERVSEYAPENWPRSEFAGLLPAELNSLVERIQALLPQENPPPIPETALLQRLEETRQLAGDCQRLRQRLEGLENRLREIQAREKTAQEVLNSLQAGFTQNTFLVQSNTFLAEIAGQDLDRLGKDLEKMSEQLADRQRSTIEKKARQVNDLQSKLEQAGNNWVDRLNKGIRAQVQSLSDGLSSMDAIANLDEKAVSEARRVLSQSQALGLYETSAKSHLPFTELSAELKRRSDFWHISSAALRALQEVQETVAEVYHQASENRRAVQKALEELTPSGREKRPWPPAALSLDPQRQEFDKLEDQWQALKNKPIRAIHLVAQLGNLSGKYQALAEKIFQASERAARERSQVQELEGEINEMAQLWQNQWYAYRDQIEPAREIRELVDAIDQELRQIRRRYQQGEWSYEQVLQGLKSLQRKIKYYQVALDDDQALDIYGRVIRSRETRNINPDW